MVLTSHAQRLLVAFADDPGQDRYGRDLMAEAGLSSGALYPELVRLCRVGWLEAAWDNVGPDGSPARRRYRLTAAGLVVARSVLAKPLSTADRGRRPSSAHMRSV